MHWLFIAHPKSYAKEKFLSWTFCRKTLIYLGQIFLQFLNLMRFRKVPAPPLLFTTICGDQPPIHLEYVQLPKPPKPRHSTWAHLDSTKILVDFMGKCEPGIQTMQQKCMKYTWIHKSRKISIHVYSLTIHKCICGDCMTSFIFCNWENEAFESTLDVFGCFQ